jgi:hypothetical protein
MLLVCKGCFNIAFSYKYILKHIHIFIHHPILQQFDNAVVDQPPPPQPVQAAPVVAVIPLSSTPTSSYVQVSDPNTELLLLKKYLRHCLFIHNSVNILSEDDEEEQGGEVQATAKIESNLFSLPHTCLTSIDLNDCGLSDAKIELVADVLSQCILLEEISLSSNKLSDESLPYLKELMTRLPNLKLIDVSRNRLSMNGIRSLALHVECSKKWDELYPGGLARDIDHVYIHQDGLIEGLGVSWDDSQSDRKTDTLMAIDARGNFTEIEEPQLSSSNSRNNSRSGSRQGSRSGSRSGSRTTSRPGSRRTTSRPTTSSQEGGETKLESLDTSIINHDSNTLELPQIKK